MARSYKAAVVAAVVASVVGASAWGQTGERAGRAETRAETEAKARQLVERGLGFLKSRQGEDGAFTQGRGALAITALALKALSQDDAMRGTPAVKKGYDLLLANQLENGGIYRDSLASYNTAIAISALVAAREPEYRERIDKAVAYLRSLQWHVGMDGLPKGETLAEGDPRAGGWGYGSKGRPDGSNTSFALQALKEAGVSQEDPAFKAAAAFMSRTQNLSATNNAKWATNDGGFIYSPANGGESFAGSSVDESGTTRFHSYGSMTYAGVKSLLWAGVNKDDPRVVSAWRWISANWSLTENPGMVRAGPEHAADGIFYYYHIMAKSLTAYGEASVPAAGGSVDWRAELVNKLAELQRPDGSWKGGKAYMEENEVLVTCYAVLALQEVIKGGGR